MKTTNKQIKFILNDKLNLY